MAVLAPSVSQRSAHEFLAGDWETLPRPLRDGAPFDGAPSLTGRRLSSARVVELQRAKILRAALGCFAEVGYPRTTVAQIIARARVSRTCFYELFVDRDACMLALLDLLANEAERELVRAGAPALPWAERLRAGVGAVLRLLDRDPALARVCLIESLRATPAVLAHRAELVSRLTAALDCNPTARARPAHVTALTAEAQVGAALSILHARLLAEPSCPLEPLAGDLSALLALPYLPDRPFVREHSPTPSRRLEPLRVRRPQNQAHPSGHIAA